MTPCSQLEHDKDSFRNEHKTHVLWEPNMRLKSGAFDEIVGKENLLPLGWTFKWDVRRSVGSHFAAMRRDSS